MSIQSRLIEYSDGEITYEGMLAWDSNNRGKRPGMPSRTRPRMTPNAALFMMRGQTGVPGWP